MTSIDRTKMRLHEPGQMEIVDVAEAFRFTAAQYPPTDHREGDWYFYNNRFFIASAETTGLFKTSTVLTLILLMRAVTTSS